jgi:hypothetical protein
MKTLSPIALAATLALCAGCETTTTTPEQRAAKQQRRAAEREADEQRHDAEERRHAEEDLRHKFARYSTGALKLMDTRYKDLRQASGRDLNVTVNRGLLGPKAASDSENVERVLEVERELLRRWKAGDAEAYLPEFGPSATGQLSPTRPPTTNP